MNDDERALSEAHDRGYQDGYDECRAELLTTFDKWLRRKDTKAQMQERIDYKIDKAKSIGRWPEGWE